MKIALTRSESNFTGYTDWLEYYKVNYEILEFENTAEADRIFEECSGLILSGGVDVYPELYCDRERVETGETYIPERDSFELTIIEKAIERELPILAICRGLQLMNVYFRGSLIFDLPECRNVDHSRISRTEIRFHDIKIFSGTLLSELLKKDSAKVTSSHHQSIDRLGEGLLINAKSNDGIIEGIEYADKSGKPFFLGVQWHPERYPKINNPDSEIILKYFMKECEVTK